MDLQEAPLWPGERFRKFWQRQSQMPSFYCEQIWQNLAGVTGSLVTAVLTLQKSALVYIAFKVQHTAKFPAYH